MPNALFGPGYKAGARIHSASWGALDANEYNHFDSLIDHFLFNNPDFLFVVAAGNEGRGNTWHTVGSPATTKNSVAVGASQNHRSRGSADGEDYLAAFSSRGPTRDGRIKPDVVAPGEFIESARADPDFKGECDDTSSSGLYVSFGTSMSTPFVSGAAALIRQYFVDGWHHDGSERKSIGYNPRASLVKAVILNGAVALNGVNRSYKSAFYDRNQGFGRADLLSSLPLKGKNAIGAVFVNAKKLSHRQQDTYKVTVDDENSCQGPLSATLVWTDPAGAPNCNLGCVLNDLDLSVRRQDTSGVIFPNGRNQPDTLNNAERVRIDDPVVGATYIVNVKGAELFQTQEYSLVITGCIAPGERNSNDEDGDTLEQGADSKSDCADGRQLIAVSDREMKSCGWLKDTSRDTLLSLYIARRGL